MPTYDRACRSCDWATDFSLEKFEQRDLSCPMCGGSTVRFTSRAPHMFRDTLAVPLIDTTMARETQVFQTRSEHKKAMEARGLRLMDTHVPLPGTDKSPHTVKWESGRQAFSESDRVRAERLANDTHFQAARRRALEAD